MGGSSDEQYEASSPTGQEGAVLMEMPSFVTGEYFADLSPAAREILDREKKKLEDAKEEVERVTRDHLAALEELEGYKKRWNSAVEARFENESVMQSEVDRLKKEATQKNELKRRLKSMETDFAATRRELELVERAKDEAEKRAEKLDDTLSQINSLNETALQTLRVQLDDSRSRLRRVEGEVTKERDTLKKQLEVARNIINEIQGKRKAEEESASKIHAEAKKYLSEEAALRFQIAVHVQDAERAAAEIASLERNIEEYSSLNANLEEQVEDSNKAVEKLKSMLDKANAEIRQMKRVQTAVAKELCDERMGRFATDSRAKELEQAVAMLRGRCAADGGDIPDYPGSPTGVVPARTNQHINESFPSALRNAKPLPSKTRAFSELLTSVDGRPRLWQTCSAVLIGLAVHSVAPTILAQA